MRSNAGVGITPPNVLGEPKPQSSVMMSKILGASLGGTTVGAHHDFESAAFSLITPPNFGSGGGNCPPLMVVVALGAPMTPVVWTCAQLDGAKDVARVTVAVRPYLIRLFCFMVFPSIYLQLVCAIFRYERLLYNQIISKCRREFKRGFLREFKRGQILE